MAEQQSQQHIVWLNSICRICGLPSKKLINKLSFKDELINICNIDVEQEDNEIIMPSSICGKHASQLYRYRKAKENGKAFTSSISVCSFGQHSDICPCMGNKELLYLTYAIEIYEQENNNDNNNKKNEEELICPLIQAFRNVPDGDKKETLENFIDGINSEQKAILVSAIMNSEGKHITRDIEHIQESYKTLEAIKDINLKEYLSDRNDFVKGVLGMLTKCNFDTELDECTQCSMSVLLEHAYKLRNAQFIGPVSLLQNLTIFSLSHSKTVTDIIGNISAGGKYTTVCKMLDNNSKPPTPPNGDAVYVFDNEQVVGKTWTIKPNNKSKSSVITNIAVAGLDENLSVQANKDLHPKEWFCENKSVDAVDKLLMENDSETRSLKQIHLAQLKLFINAAIEEAVSEHNRNSEQDHIDDIVQKSISKQKYKICPKCKDLFDKTKRKCPVCKETIVQQPLDNTNPKDTFAKIKVEKIEQLVETGNSKPDSSLKTTRYDHVKSGHTDKSIPICVIDPVFVNPNSFENLILVLRHIGKTAGVKRYGGNDREWLTVCCDGLPYTMLLKLTQEYLVCAKCRKGFIGIEKFQHHVNSEHIGEDIVEHIREFDWVHLKIGDGHYEMNLMKAFIDMNWDVFFKDLVLRMGWRSELAQKAARNCYDNHKTWQLILIHHFGILMELIIPYVRSCISNKDSCLNADGFLEYAKTCEHDPNYTFLFEMTTRYSQAIVNFRMGTRRNNSQLIQSAKYMSRGLFHGRCHPKYQLIEMYDSMQRYLQPEDLRNFTEKYETISRTNDQSKGQGFDFILEEINKEVKTWIKNGVPTDSMWLSLCRNHNILKDIREKAMGMFNVTSDSTYTKRLDLEDGIMDWRVFLRSTSYLIQPDKLRGVIHRSLCGNELHPCLTNFTETAGRKRLYRMMGTFLNQDMPDDISLKHPVFVTEAEANKFEAFENQTIQTIDGMIVEMMECIVDEDLKNELKERFLTDIKKKKKETHILFFFELEVIVKESPNLLEHVEADLDIEQTVAIENVSEFMDGIGDGSIDVQALEVALSSSGQELMVVGGDMDNLNKLLGLQFSDDADQSTEEKEQLLSDIDIQEDTMTAQSDDAVESTQQNHCLSDKIVQNEIQEDTISDGEISDEIQLGHVEANGKKRKPRKNGQYIRSPVVSPETQEVREKNRKKAALSRKKINLFKQLKSLQLATGYTGVLILKEQNYKGIIYGGTDGEMIQKFENGLPLLHTEEMEEKCRKDKKKIDMSKIMDRIACSGREVSGLVPGTPLPSPSKLPSCLSDLALSQQNELVNININMDDSTSLVSPPVIKKKKTNSSCYS